MTGGQQTHAAVWFSLKRPLTVITRWLRQSRATPRSIRACLPLHCLPPSLPPRTFLPSIPAVRTSFPPFYVRPSLPYIPHGDRVWLTHRFPSPSHRRLNNSYLLDRSPCPSPYRNVEGPTRHDLALL